MALPRHWSGVGVSTEAVSRPAGCEAATLAVGDRTPALMVVFASADHDLAALVRGIKEAVPGDAPLVGCTTAGELASDGRHQQAGSTGVVVFALGGEGIEARAAAAVVADGDLRSAGAGAAASALPPPGAATGHQVLMLLADGLAGDQQEVVRGAYSVAGAGVRLVGGCAGDDLRMHATSQLIDDRVLTGAVVAVSITSDTPIGIGVSHGWRQVGRPVVVTGASGTKVQSLEGRPALDLYLDVLDAPEAARRDPVAFTHFAQTHPLGLERRAGVSVRYVAGADFATRELVCIAEVPEGGLAHVMAGDSDSVLRATDDACLGALAQLDSASPIGMLAFDCIARRGVLGDHGIAREIDQMATLVPGAAIAGLYTYGEFARLSGMSGFHNQTLVVLAFS